VDVNVIYGLSSVLTGVDDEAKPFFSAPLVPKFGRDFEEMRRNRGVAGKKLRYGCKMSQRHSQQMDRCLRLDVRDDDNVVIAIHALRRELAAADFAKNAVCGQCVRIQKLHDFVVVLPASSATRTVT
jgi:hypothetical protein